MQESFEIVRESFVFAMAAHGALGQTRKGSDEPYVEHCKRVADTVAEYHRNPIVIAAALLHDTVEDTAVTSDMIGDVFGKDVQELVHWVTNVATKADGNRAARTAINIAHVSAAPPLAQSIKVADILDNTRDVVDVDRKFAKVYLMEKHKMLQALDKAHPELRKRALDQVTRSIRELGLQSPSIH